MSNDYLIGTGNILAAIAIDLSQRASTRMTAQERETLESALKDWRTSQYREPAAPGTLSDEQIAKIITAHGTGGWQTVADMQRFAGAILAAAGNSQSQDAAPARMRKMPILYGNEPFTAQQLSDRMDKICGCNGRHDCDCVSVKKKARSDMWYEFNARGRAAMGKQEGGEGA